MVQHYEPDEIRANRLHHAGGIRTRIRLLVSVSAIAQFAIDRLPWMESGLCPFRPELREFSHSAANRAGRNAMEQGYYLKRSREELSASVGAACSEARIIHLDLAERYGVKATEAAGAARTSRAYGICDDGRLRFVA